MDITERFLKYTQFDTQSSEESQTVPSTSKQLIFAKYLKEELEREGMSDVEMDEQGYIYATLKANTKKNIPTIGFISHYDTSPDCSGADIRPRIVENYDGSDIVLSEGIVSSPTKFPELKAHIGEDIIVTDGTTLLGADDKAGIAEIVQAMCWLRDHDEVEHGDIRIAFNPDEEIGMGAHHFNVEKFGCEWAYTIDGGDLGELEYENFNAAAATVTIHGFSVHPGSAKDTMINASNVAMEFHGALPVMARPETTEGRQGFYHLCQMYGDVTTAKLGYILRDHDAAKLQFKKDNMQDIADYLNGKYGAGTVEVEIKDSYRNMLEKIKPHFHLIETARKAVRMAGLEPVEVPVRGGTDGATLSWNGLPCPNLGTGGFNFHGVCECTTVERMDRCTEIVLNIISLYAE